MSKDRLIEKLSEFASHYGKAEGRNATAVPYFEILKSSTQTPLNYGILRPSFCIILQGQKRVLLGDQVLRYGPGIYLASLLDIPAAGQVIGATRKEPYLGLRIEYSLDEINSVLNEAAFEFKSEGKSGAAAFTASATEPVLEVFLRLFHLLEAEKNEPYLSTLLKKELIYRLLASEAGYLFAQKTLLRPLDAGLGKAIHWLKDHFAEPLSVERLAKNCHMSVSSLHHKFKSFTSMGPLQFQKQLRLQEARRLLLNGEEGDATSAAFRVGYESASQFSREYKRLFGLPPRQDAKALRKLGNLEL